MCIEFYHLIKYALSERRSKVVIGKLYKLRKNSGLSQEKLVEQLDVSRQAISKWESGTAVPESEKLIAISNFFGVSVDYLLKDEDVDTTKKADSSVEEKSKMIMIDGNGIFLIACVVAIAIGAGLLLKSKKR